MNHPGIFKLPQLLVDHQKEQETMALLDDLEAVKFFNPREHLLHIIETYYSYASPDIQIRLLSFIKAEMLGLLGEKWSNHFIDLLGTNISDDLKLAIGGALDSICLSEGQANRIALLLLERNPGTQRAAFIAVNESMGVISNEIRIFLADSLSQHPAPESTYIYDLLMTNGDDDLLEKYL